MRRVKIIFGLSLALLLTLLLWRDDTAPKPLESYARSQLLMGDVLVSIQLVAPFQARQEAWQAMGEAFALARQIEAAVSEYQPASELSDLHRATVGAWVPIGRDLSHLLRRSHTISALTGGRFDITYETPAVSYRSIEVSSDGTKARWHDATGHISLSGIAKGYIVDRMAEHLLSHNWRAFLINAGGDIRSSGSSPEGPWLVKLHHEPKSRFRQDCLLTLNNQSIATSGLYARGRHIRDARDNRPVDAHWMSVSVIAPDAQTADALATAAYASEEAAPSSLTQWLEYQPNTAAILIDSEGHLTTVGIDRTMTEITCQPLNGDSKNEISMELRK